MANMQRQSNEIYSKIGSTSTACQGTIKMLKDVSEKSEADKTNKQVMLDKKTLAMLSQADIRVYIYAIIKEWATIMLAIYAAINTANPVIQLIAIVVIGARQHAMGVLAHDALHNRFSKNQKINDLIGNICLAWPLFFSIQGYRYFHNLHHNYTGELRDGNRELWKTHDKSGILKKEWIFPKTKIGLIYVLIMHMLNGTGIRWIYRGLTGLIWQKNSTVEFMTRLIIVLSIGYAIINSILLKYYLIYWILPYCTWHIMVQYIRLICEHSAILSKTKGYELTRTTKANQVEQFFILPYNIGYHLEHHWYPSVPFYNLPLLHKELSKHKDYTDNRSYNNSVFKSMLECTLGNSRESQREGI